MQTRSMNYRTTNSSSSCIASYQSALDESSVESDQISIVNSDVNFLWETFKSFI